MVNRSDLREPEVFRWLHAKQPFRTLIPAAERSAGWRSVVAIGIAVVCPAWLAFGSASISMGVSFSTYCLVTLPVIAIFTLLLGSAVSNRVSPPLTRFDPPTPWRLADAELSRWCVWRADLGRFPPEIEGPGRPKHIESFICRLLYDWPGRSFTRGSIVRISGAISPAKSPFGDGPDAWKVYRITLEDDFKRPATGWLRLGEGWVCQIKIPCGTAG
jgi:hypothetical protein